MIAFGFEPGIWFGFEPGISNLNQFRTWTNSVLSCQIESGQIIIVYGFFNAPTTVMIAISVE